MAPRSPDKDPGDSLQARYGQRDDQNRLEIKHSPAPASRTPAAFSFSIVRTSQVLREHASARDSCKNWLEFIGIDRWSRVIA
jgi:hypothetical protein